MRNKKHQAALDAIAAIAGEDGTITGADREPFLKEWRGRWHGNASLVVMPSSVDKIARIVRICAANNIGITPQGGNTGVVGGQIPSGGEILLLPGRLNGIRRLSLSDSTMTVDAGITLAAVQQAAAEAGRLFPLSIGSEGSCQIGGVISTNAGGINVLRYGNMRELVLGLEAVMPDGRIWNGLRRLRKDNTGYDMKQLLIGGEGTLGIITGAVLKLFPRPLETVTVMAGTTDTAHAVTLLSRTQQITGGAVSSFELVSRLCMDCVLRHIPDTRDPMETAYPWYVLMEFTSAQPGDLDTTVGTMLETALEKGLLADAVIAGSTAQAAALWRMRHALSEAIGCEGGTGVRLDISVATGDIPAFLARADAAVARTSPGARIAAFGHAGDGNIHYDIIPPAGNCADFPGRERDRIETAVYDVVDSLDGSVAAEHGIGQAGRTALAKRKSTLELDMMRAVKNALDPAGIMNPGKML